MFEQTIPGGSARFLLNHDYSNILQKGSGLLPSMGFHVHVRAEGTTTTSKVYRYPDWLWGQPLYYEGTTNKPDVIGSVVKVNPKV